MIERRPLWEIFCPKTPCSHFYRYVEECCVVQPWTKESERYVSFNLSVNINVIIFIYYHLTCYFSFIQYHLAHTREEAKNEVRGKTVFDMPTEVHLHFPKIFIQLLIYPVTVFSLGMLEMQLSHICILSRKRHLLCSVKTLFWGGVGAGSAIYNWLFFQYLLQYTILIFFFEFWLD